MTILLLWVIIFLEAYLKSLQILYKLVVICFQLLIFVLLVTTLRNIYKRIQHGQAIDEVWILNDGNMRLIYKKTKPQ